MTIYVMALLTSLSAHATVNLCLSEYSEIGAGEKTFFGGKIDTQLAPDVARFVMNYSDHYRAFPKDFKALDLLNDYQSERDTESFDHVKSSLDATADLAKEFDKAGKPVSDYVACLRKSLIVSLKSLPESSNFKLKPAKFIGPLEH